MLKGNNCQSGSFPRNNRCVKCNDNCINTETCSNDSDCQIYCKKECDEFKAIEANKDSRCGRRVNPEEVARNFKLFASETFFDTENYEQFKYELVLKSLEHIMWQEYNMGWEDLPEQQEIDYVNKIAEMYKDVIYSMYLYYYNR